MKRGNIPLGRILGIPIGLDYSWFLIVALMTWMLADSYYPQEFPQWAPWLCWVMGAVTAVMLFVSVLLHELGHATVALRYGVPVRSITLFLFGGVAQIGSEPPSAAAEFWIAIAGPLVSLALAGLFYGLQLVTGAVEPLWGLVKYLAAINFILVIFNLVPGYPLDGGRVFRAIVWAITRNMRQATMVAASVGRFFGLSFIFLGIWMMLTRDFGAGLWLAFIGWFLDSAANAQMQQVVLQGLLAGHTVSQAMSRRCESVPESVMLQQLVDEHILGSGRRCLLVHRGDDTVGMMTLGQVKDVPRDHWPTTTAGNVMLPLEQLRRISPDNALWSALQEMDRDGVNQLPVVTDGRVVGMLSREDVISYLRTLEELNAYTSSGNSSQV